MPALAPNTNERPLPAVGANEGDYNVARSQQRRLLEKNFSDILHYIANMKLFLIEEKIKHDLGDSEYAPYFSVIRKAIEARTVGR